ncbi:MAG TPA: CDP-glycerol glycerophosphotransferase family protein [Candidatus Paceibacterota bacterium]
MTILLPIFNGLRARNFFLTDLYPELLKGGAHLVILVPSHKVEYYRKTYAHSQVVFESWDPQREHWFGRALQWLAFNALGTGTVRRKQYAFFVRDRNILKFAIRRLVGVLFGGSRLFRKFLRILDRAIPADYSVAALIAKHKPSLVLAPDIILVSDRLALRAAKRAIVPTVGMVRSWDNLTAKGVIQVMPDWLVAQTDVMKEEVVRLGDMERGRIRVCGVSQFDEYWKPATKTREEFLRSLSIPTERRVVLCAPFFGEYSQSSGIMLVQKLARAIDDGRLPKDIHLLVRYRPEDLTAPKAPDTAHFNHPRITVTKPYSVPFKTSRGKSDFEFTRADVDLMVNSLRWSDVVITTISTLTVDAIALNKPVINIRFDVDPHTPAQDRVELFSHFDHYLALEKTGGVRLAHSFEELLERLHVYLNSPSLDNGGRARVRREQIQYEDALSGARSAQAILRVASGS